MSASTTIGLLVGVFAVLFAATLIFGLPIMLARYQQKFEKRVGDNLHSAFIFLDSRQIFTSQTVLTLVGVAFIWYFTKQLFWVCVFALAIGLLPTLTLFILRRRRARAFRDQLPDAITVIASAMRAGNGLSLALNHVAKELADPIAQEIELVLRECRLGSTLTQSLAALERRFPSEEVKLFCAAIDISQETGGNLAETLEALAGAMRTKMQIEGKLSALTSQGKMQGVIVGLLPFAVLLMISVIEPATIEPLFTTKSGWIACSLVLVLEALGAIFIRKIVRINI
jgi:tight adherence protein B